MSKPKKLPVPNQGANHRFLGRQAILDEKMQHYGYELLFRNGGNNEFTGDAEDATRQTIDCCLSMAACLSNTNLFVNCTRDSLVNMTVKLLPRRVVVLEVLETVIVDEEVLRACRKLKALGYRLALDDFNPDNANPQMLEIADYIKIDFRLAGPEVRREIYQMTRNPKTIFLAEKVETLEEVQTAQAEGNTLFQGYYYSRPEIVAEPQLSANKATYLRLLTGLAAPTIDWQKMEHLILTEPSLCFRLLRLVNSAASGLRYRISTIQGALHIVGEDTLRKLVTVVLATQLQSTTVDRDMEQAIERAYFCESLATVLNESPAELYMLGMFSMMDRMLSIPMTQLVELIGVGSRMQKALLGATDDLGRALVLCSYHERGGGIHYAARDVPQSDTTNNYFGAILTAGQSLRSLPR